MMDEPDFTIGLEEEYLLVDQETLTLAVAPDELFSDCEEILGAQVSPEYLQCQMEVGTRVCETIGEARDDLRALRRAIRDNAANYGLTPIAASCHPLANWKDQHHRSKDRYNQLRQDLGGVVRRMLICGMHVHVGLGSDALRADLLGQMSYFLPHLLALSTSSPFWQGEDTGLASYRISIFDNLPRTGLPPRLDSWDEYVRSVRALVDLGVIEDSSKIWWDLRPSARFPTLEARICDVSPRLEHALSLAATIQAITRMLWRLRTNNQRWRLYDNFLIQENRWRAQRYGTTEGLIDFGRGEIVPFQELLEELIALIEEDAGVLQSTTEVHALRDIMANGTSAERQRRVAQEAEAQGADKTEQMAQVVKHLVDEFSMDL